MKVLEEELNKLPDADKANYLKAKEKCPELVDSKFKLVFLRCEVFNADVSGHPNLIFWMIRHVGLYLLLRPSFCLFVHFPPPC